jgi:hypothetical protein
MAFCIKAKSSAGIEPMNSRNARGLLLPMASSAAGARFGCGHFVLRNATRFPSVGRDADLWVTIHISFRRG